MFARNNLSFVSLFDNKIRWNKHETFLCYETPLDPLANFSGKHLVIVGSISFHTSANCKRILASVISIHSIFQTYANILTN